MLKVLVIDADSDFASLVGRSLLKAGHETRIVGDAKYGIVRAKAFVADLVLLSGTLSGVSIPDFIKELKPMVPGRIVVCGNSEDAGIITTAVTAGAADYVLKNSGPVKILAGVLKDTDPEEDAGESAAEHKPVNKGMKDLRAPVKEGKRPFVVVVAHPDEEKRAFQTEVIERLNTSLHVMEVSTSAEAIQACAENRTIMAVMDWELTEPITKQAMKTIRETKTGKGIAMFITYKGNSPEKQRVAEFSGAIAFSGEPWDDGSFEGQIGHILTVIRHRRRKAKMQALKTQQEKQAAAS